MPRRRLVLLALLAALALPAAALAGNGGVAPAPSATPSNTAIKTVYWFVFAFCAFFFVAVETTLVLFAFRFRRRRGTPADVEGPQIHGNTRLELFWTVVPALGLVAIAVFVFAKIPDVRASRAADARNALAIRVEGHQFYWEYRYPNGAISLDTLRLPVNRPVRLELVTYDVNHSWWVPELDGKLDLIPGRTNVLSFTPSKLGTFADGKCAELCGIQHAVMTTTVDVVPAGEYDSWVRDTASAQASGTNLQLGKETWTAVCAKCHSLDGSGGIGPSIQGNGRMRTVAALGTLVRNGQNTATFDYYMPPVGRGWPDRQLQALVAYIKSSKTLSGTGGPGGG